MNQQNWKFKMKPQTGYKAVFRLGWALVWLTVMGWTTSAQVAFTVTPAAVSNSYNGPITLLVSGLTNGETVLVQKYLDVNGNGVIDAGDLLWQQFALTDGTNFSLGGVMDANVPGDTDTTPGQITAKLNLQAEFSQILTAKYIYELSSPAGHFQPLTCTFTVTNFPWGQSFTGMVLNNGVAVPNASIILFPGANGGGNGPGNPVGGAIADNTGAYALPAPPGTYILAAFKTNFVANLASAYGLVLTNGTPFSTNLNLLAATTTISGRVADAGNSNLGLAGLLLAAQTKNGLLGICVTDTNGNYSMGVTAQKWGIGSDSAGLAFHGYLSLQNKTVVDTTTGSVAGVNLAPPRATALFYGWVTNGLGNPLPGEVAVYVEDNNNNIYEADGYTDATGYYTAAALGGLGVNDPWYVSIDNSSIFPGDIFSAPACDQNGGTNLSAGVAVPASIVAIPATHSITGNVQHNGTNLVGVSVSAYATIGGVNYNLQSVDTDGNGNYTLTVANGTWNVFVSCQGGNDSLDGLLGPANYQCPENDTVPINNANGTANFTVSAGGGSGQIYGQVTDSNHDPVTGVKVYASTNSGGNNPTTTTDGNGDYSFNLGNGTWNVSVDCGGLTALGYQCVNSQSVTVANDQVEQDFNVSFVNSGPLQITTSDLPDGIVGGAYSQTLTATGGQLPYGWTLTPGSQPLPGGLSLSTTGLISGMPTNAPFGGTNYYFSARVTDHQGTTVDQFLSLTVYPALTLAGNSLPNGTAGTPYTAQVLVSGGDPRYLGDAPDGYEAYFPSGPLPDGLVFSYGTLTSSNEYLVISGTPTNSGTFSFILGAQDADGNEVQRNISVTILGASLTITTTSLTNATVGVFYADPLLGSGGTPPYTWTIAQGSQPAPPGVALSTNGLLAGVPTTIGTNYFIVRLTDFNSVTTTKSFSLVINPRPQLGAPAQLSGTRFQFWLSGVAGQNYTLQVSTNLNSTNWTPLFMTNNAATNAFLVTDPNATNRQRFYRVLIGP